MKPPRFTLVADGTSDGAMLVPILRWLLRTHYPAVGINIEYADPRHHFKPLTKPHEKIAFALKSYPCECLFVHRDAEKDPPDNRRREIQTAINALKETRPIVHICVVPVRMSEAWLLFDEPAIRRAAGNPNGKVKLDMPRLATLEDIPDPKEQLYNLLIKASEYSGRRLRTFKPHDKSRLVAQHLDDFSPLRQLSAFQNLEADLQRVVLENGWNMGE